MEPNTFYITTPIYYVNADPHIGHVYSTLVADCLARYHQLSKKKVFMVTGTDEHGLKVEQKANSVGKTCKDYADEISNRFKACFSMLGLEYDRFIRTTDSDHIQTVISLWNTLFEKGDIYQGSYEGWYSIADETFVADSAVVDGIFVETGNKVTRTKEQNYLFKLSKYQEQILAWLHTSPIIPECRNREMIKFVEGGLHDISVSRKKSISEWGIEVPNSSDDIIYVWLDALANYLTAAPTPQQPADIHVVGKDILKFHAVYWIGFLLSANLPLPKKILAHGWWLCNGVKMSKSIGNVIDPIAISRKYGNDVLRYFLLRESCFSTDSNYREDILIMRLNSDLADTLGNLVTRSLSGKLNPTGKIPMVDPTQLIQEDLDLISAWSTTVDGCNYAMTMLDIQNYIITLWSFIVGLNGYITRQKPWKLQGERFSTVQGLILEHLGLVAYMLGPILPETSNKILGYLSVNNDGLVEPDAAIQTDVPILFSKAESARPFG